MLQEHCSWIWLHGTAKEYLTIQSKVDLSSWLLGYWELDIWRRFLKNFISCWYNLAEVVKVKKIFVQNALFVGRVFHSNTSTSLVQYTGKVQYNRSLMLLLCHILFVWNNMDQNGRNWLQIQSLFCFNASATLQRCPVQHALWLTNWFTFSQQNIPLATIKTLSQLGHNLKSGESNNYSVWIWCTESYRLIERNIGRQLHFG